MPAANLALTDVNREKNLLPGFELKLHSNDSEVRKKFLFLFFILVIFFILVRTWVGSLGDVQFVVQRATEADVARRVLHCLYYSCRSLQNVEFSRRKCFE